MCTDTQHLLLAHSYKEEIVELGSRHREDCFSANEDYVIDIFNLEKDRLPDFIFNNIKFYKVSNFGDFKYPDFKRIVDFDSYDLINGLDDEMLVNNIINSTKEEKVLLKKSQLKLTELITDVKIVRRGADQPTQLNFIYEGLSYKYLFKNEGE